MSKKCNINQKILYQFSNQVAEENMKAYENIKTILGLTVSRRRAIRVEHVLGMFMVQVSISASPVERFSGT